MSNIIDILTDDRFKMNENDNTAIESSLEAIEKIFNEISKKTAADVTTDDMKQIVGALQNLRYTANDKNVLVVNRNNILKVANNLYQKVAAKEKFYAEQNQQQGQQPQQQSTQQVQPETDKTVDKDAALKTPVTKADAAEILNYLNSTKEVLVKKLNAQGDDKVKVKKFLNNVIIGIDNAINAAKKLNGEVNNKPF
jgi:Tfp pilus assembly protein PilE